MSREIKNIVILGGGSAGWLVAGVLASAYKTKTSDSIRITVVESPDIAAIGVGEGTWPSMRSTLMSMGISETDFIRQCDVSFKQGSQFVGWRNGDEKDRYYHPFSLPSGLGEPHLSIALRKYGGDAPFAEAYCEQPALCDAFRAPKQAGTAEYAGALNYGYHLDSVRFGRLLRDHCIEILGVQHRVAHVERVISDDTGNISALQTGDNDQVSGDFFIDCSGTHSRLLGEHFGIPFVSKSDVSINDSAIAIQVPYADEQAPIASTTIASAQKAGWIWDIHLASRRGVGHVYASEFMSHDQAEYLLRDYIARDFGVDAVKRLEARHLKINPGHRAKFWHKNCVAVGMAAGFIEPLEASALVMVELAAQYIRDELPCSRDAMEVVAQRYNQLSIYRWENVIDFLKLHYLLSQRRDSAYWREVSREDNASAELKELLTLWRHREPYWRDFPQAEQLFPVASYLYILYGMGFETQEGILKQNTSKYHNEYQAFKEAQSKVSRCMANLPTNRELLLNLKTHRFPVI